MIGVLALQGDFEKHEGKLRELGAHPKKVQKLEDLHDLTGLIIPGGESSVLLKLSVGELRNALREKIQKGLPTLATCAGVIFLAKEVENPTQESLSLLDITVRRNAYGRQKESFIDDKLQFTDAGVSALRQHKIESTPAFEGVFIRAPKIVRIGANVEIFAERNGEPIFVRQKNILALTFHPELSEATAIHRMFLAICGQK